MTLTGLAASTSDGLLALTGLLALIVLTVVVPAIWSRNEQRRKDALAVLDVFFGRGDQGD